MPDPRDGGARETGSLDSDHPPATLSGYIEGVSKHNLAADESTKRKRGTYGENVEVWGDSPQNLALRLAPHSATLK